MKSSIQQQRCNQQIVAKILKLSNESGDLLIDKFNTQFIIGYLDRSKIQSIGKIYESKEGGFSIIEFVRFFLNVIDHKDVETLYLVVALIDFFREISQTNGFCERIKFTHITNFICSKLLEKRNSENQIQTKFISTQKSIKPNFGLKDYLINPPTIYGSNEDSVHKLSLNKMSIDKNKHQKVITNSFFSPSLNRIFALDALADYISVYDTQCNLLRKIRPQSSHLKKNTILLSSAFSQRQERIGAVLKDFSLIFWDSSDNFTFEKVISTALHCNQYQTTIHYLKHFNKWVTSDKGGNIYVWNIETQEPERCIKCKFKAKINDLCQIPCLNLLAIVQQNKNLNFDNAKRSLILGELAIKTTIMQQKQMCNTVKETLDAKKIQELQQKFRQSISSQQKGQLQQEKNQKLKNFIYLYNFFKGQSVAKIDLGVEGRIPHTIQYSEEYQVIITASYEKKINLYEIHPKYLDTNLKGSLLGHQTLVTCFTTIANTPMIFSSDDRGKIKIWDIRNYKCIQTLDFKDKTIVTRLLSLIEVGKIGILGSRMILVEFDDKNQLRKKNLKKQRLFPIAIDCDYSNLELIVLTKSDLRVFDIKKGSVKHIFCELVSNQEEITCFKYLEILKKFVVGNQRGQLKVYCARTGQLEKKLISHASSVNFIEYDQSNKLFITGSSDSMILVQRQDPSWGPMKQIRNNFHQKDIICMSVSSYHGLIAVGSTDNLVYVWDYQYIKILVEIRLPQNCQPTALQFINYYSMLAVGCSNGHTYFFTISRREDHAICKFIYQFKCQSQPTHLLADVMIKGTQKKQKVSSTFIYVASASGSIFQLDLRQIVEKIKVQPSVTSKSSYNPERHLKQNFITQIDKKKFCTIDTQNLVNKTTQQNAECSVKVKIIGKHNSQLTGMKIIEMDYRYLFTSSTDYRIKIWKSEQQLCDYNINHPLPYQWDLNCVQQSKIKDKIMIGLKVIQTIFKKYGSDISIGQSKVLQVQKLFSEIENQNAANHLTQPRISKKEQKISKKINLFQEEFTLQDLHYDLVKKYNFKEIAGPSLRQIEMKKKIDTMYRQWSQNKKKEQQEKEQLLSNIQHRAQKIQEKDQITSFLKDKNRKSNDFSKSSNQSMFTSSLKNKLNLIHDRQNAQNTVSGSNRKQNKATIFISNYFQNKLSKVSLKKQRTLKTFENYYQQRENQPHYPSQNISQSEKNKGRLSFKKISNTPSFRDILADMNNRIRISRKNKLRSHQNSYNSSPLVTPNSYSKTQINFHTTSSSRLCKNRNTNIHQIQ